MSIIKDGSMLSNISNISVLIKPGDGSSIFNFPMHSNINEGDNSLRPCEVKIEDIFPFESNFNSNNSLFEKYIKRQDRQGSSINYYHTPIVPQFTYNGSFNERSWRITQQKGVSEDQNSVEESEVENQANDKKVKNQTKNIPKNYGKAIISFIEKYKDVVQQVCEYTNVPFQSFFKQMVEEKKTINTIADLRRLWIDYKYARCMRILSNLFFRKYSLNYIFNSRICNFRSHIKYRHRLWEAIRNPRAFRHIKDY